MKDILTNADVTLLVDTFYAKARKNTFIGPIFDAYITDWDRHHIKLYQFWRTVILRQSAYQAKPVQMHFKMELTQDHFDRWMEIWEQNIKEHFEGPNADIAIHRGKTMSQAFLKIIERNK